MSVTELNSRHEEEPPAPGYDRTPPQDVAAEQAVLGGMLLSKDAIADVVEVLRGHDFYRPAHETIYEAILDLYGRGEPADPLTVADALQKAGDLGRVGGAPYLHTLVNYVPTAANAAFYAEIVRERAILRRLVEAGTRIVQMGYTADGEVDDIVDTAQAEVYAVTERRTSEDYLPLSEIMEGALDEIEAIGSHGGQMVGVPTGFADLDALTNGLHPGQMIVVAARPAIGKALALDTPLPTPTGWTTMGEVQVGDELIGADGRPTRVVAATEVMEGRPCYEVEFSDGSVIVADAQHQWVTTTRASRRAATERKPPSFYWSSDAIQHVLHVAESSQSQPNRPISRRDAVAEVGQEFRNVIHSVAAGIPPCGRGPSLIHQNSRATLLYSRLQLHSALADRASRPVNSWHAVEHEAVITTEQMASTLYCKSSDRRLNHQVRLAEPLVLPPADLPLPPYTFGVWLGDDHSAGARYTSGDPEIAEYIRQEELEVMAKSGRNYQLRLRSMGVLNNKHIPPAYLRASEAQRRSLLAGLLDSDGHAMKLHGTVQFSVTNRRLAEDVLELIHSLGYRATMKTERVNGRSEASSTAYTITFMPRDKVFRLRRKLERQRLDHVPRGRTVVDVRRIESVPVRCVQVDSHDHLYLTGRSFIPTHNSTLGLDLARAAAIKHQLTTVLFSLEMSRNEITMRLLSAEARVPLHHMRSGQMTDEDWNRIARRTGEVSSAPLFIDDSPNMTMMEIRAKCRRLKQRHQLRLVIVDYLQLMTSGKRVESRQQEVAEFSRALKLLAKELDVPVVAVAQLNRGPEQRQDKKPLLSDLRESGCLPASTRVLRADTGAEVTLGELLTTVQRNVPVWALDESLRYVPRTMTHVFPSGRKPVFRLRLASGREIDATANHPFLTYDGWSALGELGVGSRIAVPRHVPAPLVITPWADSEVVLLAHLIGDGSFVRNQPIRYASVDEHNLSAVKAAATHFGVTAVRDDYESARVWLDGLGLFDLRSHEKFIPQGVFSLPKRQIALFLRHLWATDGSVTLNRKRTGGRIYYTSTSRRLLDDVAALLLRFGISTRLRTATTKQPYRRQYTLDISGRDEQIRFLREIGCHGDRAAACSRLLEVLESVKANTDVDTVPKEVWEHVGDLLTEQGITQRQFAAAINTQSCGSTLWKRAPSRERLGRIASLLGDAELEMYATNDVFWDTVVDVEPLGEQEVYDATVLGLHNFVANGIAVHNSIEQDSDMVLLLHREDAYERESPRAGEADFIVAKHRNGPTATITVAFQGHYSRFVDMAQ